MFGQRKRRVVDEDYGPDLNRVVTPMLDMSFQLLFLFIVQFRPMIEEGQLDLSLPAQDVSSTSTAFQPLDPDDQKPDEYTIHINSIVPKGSDKPVVIDREDIGYVRYTSKIETIDFPTDDLLGKMEEKLKTIPAYVEGKDKKKPTTIKLQINNKLKYSEVIELMDRCRRIGKEKNIKDIGLMGYPKDRAVPAAMP